MAQVSKKKVKKEILQRIQRRFIESVVSLKSMQKGGAFLDELLAETEQVMLAKRLAIIFMLLEGASSYRIHKTLHVSTSTVLRIKSRLIHGEFNTVRQYLRKKHEREKFWLDLEVLVRLGMPEYGSGRWKWLDEMDRKYKHKTTRNIKNKYSDASL